MNACPWDGFEPGSIRFCEERLCSWVAEPANAWSNAAFIVIGCYVLWRASRYAADPIRLIGVTSIMVGFGSFFFHASGTWIGEFVDLSTMFLISSLMLSLELRRLFALTTRATIVTYLSLSISAIVIIIPFRVVGIPLFDLHLLTTIGAHVLCARKGLVANRRWMYALIATYLLASVVWALDYTGKLCDPTNHIFTGHSAWHVLAAVCMYLFYRYQRQFFDPRDVAVDGGS
jgi:hypothetical protein